jgi:hypothetical protein
MVAAVRYMICPVITKLFLSFKTGHSSKGILILMKLYLRYINSNETVLTNVYAFTDFSAIKEKRNTLSGRSNN